MVTARVYPVVRYTYNPTTGEYTFTSSALATLVHRVGSSKEAIEAEDAKENARRIQATKRQHGR